MSWIRNVVVAALLVVLVACAGWSRLPSPPADLAQLTGCAWVRAEQLAEGGQTVIDVGATGCAGDLADRSPPMAARAHIAGTTWQALHRPVDAIRVRLLDDIGAATEPAVFDSTALSQQYELGSAHRPARSAVSALWLLLPGAHLSAFALMCLVTARIRRAGAVLLLFKA